MAEHYPAARKSTDGWRLGNLAGDKGESLSINAQGLWQDFASGEKGDVLDLLANIEGLDTKTDFPDLLARAHERLGRPTPTRHTHANSQPTPNSRIAAPDQHREPTPGQSQQGQEPQGAPEWLVVLGEAAHAALEVQASPEAKRAREYLAGRGLTSTRYFGVIDASVPLPAHLGDGYRRALTGRLLILYRDETDRPAYFNARDLTGRAEESHKYLKPKGASSSLPFNATALQYARRHNHLILTEGEIDAASLLEAYGPHYPVIGCTGGALPAEWLGLIADTGCRVTILADDDEPGRQKAEKLQAALAGLRGTGHVHVVTLKGHKDANAALQALGPAALIEAVENAIETAKTAATSDYLYITETFLAEIDRRADRSHSYYTTGLPELDKLLGGGYLEGLHLLGGITGGGKTSLALSIAMHNAHTGRPVLYGSYEQSRLELWARIANRVTNVPQRAMKAGWYEAGTDRRRTSDVLRESEHWAELEKLAKYLKVVEGGDALSRQEGSWSVEALANAARETAEAHGAPPLIIIDYLQRMPVPAEVRPRDVRERVGMVAGLLQTLLGRDLAAPILALSSVGRASYNSEAFSRASDDERLAAFKEAGELEYTAYSALLLYALPESKRGNTMYPHQTVYGRPAFNPRTLDLVKNREGNTGRLAVKWHPERDEWLDAMPYGKDSESL